MTEIDRRVRQVGNDVDEIYGMLKRVFATQEEHGTLLREHSDALADLNAKFTGLDAKVTGLDAKFTGLFGDLDAKLDRVLDRLGPATAAGDG
jgi:hypothetical protein